MKILLVEDDVVASSTLATILGEHRYQVDCAIDGQAALDLIKTYEYDLILLDVLIPKIDGIQVCRRLRSRQCGVPILLLTAKDASSDRVMGLDAGADDYLVKPYDVEELMARIRALLRRKKNSLTSVLKWENLTCDLTLSEMHYGQHLLKLTPKEYGILELFLSNPQRVFSRSAILDRLWDLGESPGEDTVTTHIKALRQKLKAAGATKNLIETVYGLGYRLKAIDPSPEPASSVPGSVTPEKVGELMTEIWERFKDEFLEKVERLHQTAISLSHQPLTLEQREIAQQDAHKLTGTLGSFGYSKGSDLARELEQLLQSKTALSAAKMLQLVRSLQLELNPQENIAVDSTIAADSTPNTQRYRVLGIDIDRALAESLQHDAIAWNLELEIVDIAVAQDLLAQAAPDAILLNLKASNPSEGFAFLAEVAAQSPQIPVLVLSESDGLGDRLEVAKLGATAFLRQPIAAQEIFGHLNAALSQLQPTIGKILVVDDDLAILQLLPQLLASLGLHVTTLIDPQHFWRVLESYAPDLLILDISMPGFNGFELCQVVRTDARWSHLPVLFLSANDDPASVAKAFSVGADDYIRKPIVPSELISRIMGRLHPVGIRRNLQREGTCQDDSRR